MAKNWLAVNPTATTKKPVPEEGGLEIEFGFWPPLIDVQIRPRIGTLSLFDKSAAREVDYEVYREAARWSVRGWAGEGPAPVFEERELDERTFKVLSEESVEVLYRNGLLFAAGQEAIVFNC